MQIKHFDIVEQTHDTYTCHLFFRDDENEKPTIIKVTDHEVVSVLEIDDPEPNFWGSYFGPSEIKEVAQMKVDGKKIQLKILRGEGCGYDLVS